MIPFPPLRIFALLLTGGLFLAGAALGQTEEKPDAGKLPGEGTPPPPPPPPSGPNPPGRGDWHPGEERGDRRGGDRYGPGSKGPGGRPPMYGEGFEKLSEDQKRRVREALAKAWGRPEVAEARDRMMKANDDMRQAIHGALKEIDPEIATLLASMRGPEPWGGRGEPPRMPPPESPDFPREVVKRLEMELMVFSHPDRREELRKLHGVLLGQPEISAAVKRLNEAPVPERMAAMEALRRVYREGVGRMGEKLRERREGGEVREFRRPPEERK